MTNNELYNTGRLISIKDNKTFNKLSNKSELWGAKGKNEYFKLELVDITFDKENPSNEYLVFKSESLINGKKLHVSMVEESTFDMIYDYDKSLVDSVLKDFRNINRVCIDNNYTGLSNFLNVYNKLKEKYPEKMI